jgi:hypothetical protein
MAVASRSVPGRAAAAAGWTTSASTCSTVADYEQTVRCWLRWHYADRADRVLPERRGSSAALDLGDGAGSSRWWSRARRRPSAPTVPYVLVGTQASPRARAGAVAGSTGPRTTRCLHPHDRDSKAVSASTTSCRCRASARSARISLSLTACRPHSTSPAIRSKRRDIAAGCERPGVAPGGRALAGASRCRVPHDAVGLTPRRWRTVAAEGGPPRSQLMASFHRRRRRGARRVL